MIFLIKTLQLILSLSVLVMVHEFGHFFFARLFGVRVDKFYMFFNPKFSIFRAKKIEGRWRFKFFAPNHPDNLIQARNADGTLKFTKKGKPVMIEDSVDKLPEDDWRRYPETTEWGIGWVPFGGYCSMVGMVDETTSIDQLSDKAEAWEFRSKPAWQRFFIIVGGVLFNFIFAMIIYAMILFANGEEYLPVENATLGYNYCSTAQKYGLQDGDRILSIGGQKPETQKDIVEWLVIEGRKEVVVDRQGAKVDLQMPDDFGEQLLEAEEMQFMSVRMPFVVDSVDKGSVAEAFGMESGDSIISIGIEGANDYQGISQTISDNAGKQLPISLYRKGELIQDTITPDTDGKIGVFLRNPYDIFKTEKKHYGFFASFPAGIRMGWETLVSYIKQFRLVFTKAGAKSIGGFGSIGKMFPDSWDWNIFWNMTALLSVILAFMNILPIPILDGGYILFIIYEMLTGKKPSDKFMEVSLNIGMVLLFALLLYANGNDLIKWIVG